MRPFPIIVIFGAVLLQSCNMNRQAVNSNRFRTNETQTSAVPESEDTPSTANAYSESDEVSTSAAATNTAASSEPSPEPSSALLGEVAPITYPEDEVQVVESDNAEAVVGNEQEWNQEPIDQQAMQDEHMNAGYTLGDEEFIEVEEEVNPFDRQAMEDNQWRDYESKTYNELQISESEDAYPIFTDKGTRTYNEEQFSP